MRDGGGSGSHADPDAAAPVSGVTDIGDRRRGARKRGETSGPQPGASWGRFKIRRLVGEGGMGQVYEADDPSLGRRVALKLLRRDDPELLQRFLLEAKTQAQVDHDNVCKVYEAGEIHGRPFIAMQLIEGESLERAGPNLTLRERVQLMREVAEAVEAAHRMGLIHRDIKPTNILVDSANRGKDGRLRPSVVDFGLAREVGARGKTQLGSALGTPEYMAPEQAFGDSSLLDRRVDVYGLGATMYELFSGHRPYEGEKSAEILARLLDSEPRPLRSLRTDIPPDLETIVAKCMERDPERRYGSASAVADDLRRFLDGEPIRARPATLRYRLGKKLRKNRALAAAVVLLGLALVALIAYEWRAAWQAGVRARLTHRLGMEAKEIDGIMRYANLLPLHDTRRERALVRQRMRDIAGGTADYGEVGAGAADYALGLGHLALQEYRAASERLAGAWEKGYRTPEVAYARGRALGEIYRAELRALGRIEGDRPRAARRAQIESLYRDPALAFLRQGKSLETEAPELVEGEIALYEQRYDDALKLARAAYARVPWLYEARRLEGDIEELLAIDFQDRGEWGAALAHHANAGEAYAAALAAARSDAGVYGAECERRRSLVEIDYERGVYSQSSFEAAVAVCEDAIRANPDDAVAHVQAAETYWRLSEQRFSHGEDASAAVERTVALAERAARLDPKSCDAFHRLGIAHGLRAQLLDIQGKDPAAAASAAEEALRRAIALDPALAWPYNALGFVYNWQAGWQMRRGLDPDGTIAAAVTVLEDGAHRDTTFWKIYRNLGTAHVLAAERRMAAGLDPSAELALAEKAVDDALAINPQGATALAVRAAASRLRGEAAGRRGQDPRPDLERAAVAAAAALRLNPEAPEALREEAAIDLALLADRTRRGDDPSAEVIRVEEAAARLEAHNPHELAAALLPSRAHLLLAEWQLTMRRDPSVAWRRARREAESAHQRAPGDAEPLLVLAQVEVAEARGQAGSKLAEASLLCDRALGINPMLAEAQTLRADLARRPTRRRLGASG